MPWSNQGGGPWGSGGGKGPWGSGVKSRKPLAAHELGPKRALGLVLVVRAASELDPLDRGLAAAREVFDVMELEP